MRLSFTTGLLAASTGSVLVSAAATPQHAPAIPLSEFEKTKAHPLSFEQLQSVKGNTSTNGSPPTLNNFAAAAVATCSNPRIRTEWDSLDNNGKQAFVSAVKCLMGKPASGQFSNAKSRYEDFVALHQTLTPNVHGNAKFLPWHRYYIWAFEDELRSKCGYSGNLPWFDESRYAGNFAASSIFSDQWFGGVKAGGNCISNGQFAFLTLNVGPGQGNGAHCLARNNNDGYTANCAEANVNVCQSRTDYADYEACSEGGCHAWGHNGIGAVMSDVYASPGDPVFWLHHGFVDRNWRIWQNNDASRINSIDGVDHGGNPISTSTGVNILGIRPDIPIGNLLNTLSTSMCYKYNY